MLEDLESLTYRLAKADNEQEFTETLAEAIDFALGGFEHRIEAYRTEEFLTNDQIIRLNVNDTVWLLTVQEHRR